MKKSVAFPFFLLFGISISFLSSTCFDDDNPPLPTNACDKGAFYFASFDEDMDNWTVNNATNQRWEWVENGKADQTSIAGTAPNWGNRNAIQSCSNGGAMVFNGDGYNGQDSIPQIFNDTLISPVIDCSEREEVYLRFHQYFRKYQQASTKVAISNNGGSTWTALNIAVNDALQSNTETGSRDVQVMDISTLAAGFAQVRIRFEVEMSHYFWIIDDVGLFDFEPIFPLVTNPVYVGDSLTFLGYDFDVDEDGAPFVPNELMVQFADSVAEVRKQAIRDTMGVVSVDSCVCNKLELWTFGGLMIINGDTISPSQYSIDILEKDKALTAHESEGTIQGTGLNYYAHNNEMHPPPTTAIINSLPITPIFQTTNSTSKIIAVLDTGVDYNHPNIKPYIATNDGEIVGDIPDTLDNDSNCFVNDFIGWNFVEDNNNPQDNHSHGTHVAGTIIQTINSNDMTACLTPCDFKILPIRTHDENGIGNLFDALCGMYYALEENATILNASWGLPGKESPKILVNVIDSARINYDALIVAAAGNDTLEMGGNNIMRFPACVNRPNVISVASIKNNGNNYVLSDFSNSSNTLVSIGAEGDNVESYMPLYQGYLNNKHTKSGTSMATPKVSAAAFLHQCQNITGGGNLKIAIESGTGKPSLNSKISNGKILEENICQ